MNQQQSRRDDDHVQVGGIQVQVGGQCAEALAQVQGQGGGAQGQGVKYGDVFSVRGDLAGQMIAPNDADTMQRAEHVVLGGRMPGGPADTMTSAAKMNQYYGGVGGDEASEAARTQGITITETPVVGGSIVTEFVAGQVVAQYMVPDGQGGGDQVGPDEREDNNDDDTKLTIGDALEASGRAIGNEPVTPNDVAAIRAAETRATGLDVTMPGGLTDQAIAAATSNVWVTRDEEKVKLGDILSDATAKLPADKPVESEDAMRVVDAEIGGKPDARTRPGGVAAAVATAARVNRDDDI